ncbi:hypothetical protein S83_039431, partial [Arachis hypogaea]
MITIHEYNPYIFLHIWWFCFFVGDPTPSVPAETVNDGHSLVNKAALDLNLAPGSVFGKRTLINDLDAANKKLKTQDSSQTSSFSSADATSKMLLSGMAKEAARALVSAGGESSSGDHVPGPCVSCVRTQSLLSRNSFGVAFGCPVEVLLLAFLLPMLPSLA